MLKTREIYANGELIDTEQYDDGVSGAYVLSAYRYKRENEGITVSGVSIPTDIATRTNLLGAKAFNTSIKWKTASGFVLLTTEQIAAIATAVGQHVQKCFDAESEVDPAQYTTTQQIEAAFDAAYQEL